MRVAKGLFAGVMAVTVFGALPSAAVAQNPALAHMGHVADEWRDTPENMGLLPTAVAEAAVAKRHAELAMSNPDDLASIQRHMAHVAHALDPNSVEGGPGKGYGLIKAAEGAAAHIGMAGESDQASQNIQTHSGHVKASATNAAMWGAMALEKAQAAMEASDLATAAELAGEVAAITVAIADGKDADADGSISWREGEGGLAQAARHLELMKKGEGQ